MSTLQINSNNDGAWVITGALSYIAINPRFWQQSLALFNSATTPIYIDLGAVAHSDSAGVALLIAWTRLVRQQNKTIHFLHLPDQMRAIIRVSGLEKLLPLES